LVKDDQLYLGHMLDVSRQAMAKVEGLDRSEFDADENLRLALAHLIQMIGEAARRVSPATCASHPQLPWTEIIGMRHKIVHDYLGVDFDIVWEVVTADLPQLADELKRILSPSET
jgi:uncharacterized protein with HEPN domain